MELDIIKNKMIEYRDFYGFSLLDMDEIERAESKEDLSEILNHYENHLEDMLSDAKGHLYRFKKEIGLDGHE